MAAAARVRYTRPVPPTAPQLARVDELARELTAAMAATSASADALWHVKGPPTSGKSALLDAIQAQLSQRGLLPILVAPPPAELDAGPMALLQIGAGLTALPGAPRELDALSTLGPWSVKYHAVRALLQNGNCDKVVLLCDEPLSWPTRNRVDFVFASRAHDMAQLVMRDALCRRLVVGELHPSWRALASHALGAASDPERWLGDPDAWGELGQYAQQLWSAHRDELRKFSPLEVRLLVAHVVLGGVKSVAHWVAGNESRRSIARGLAQLLERQMPSLLAAWSRLSLVRKPFATDILEVCTGSGLSPLERAILERCLLYPSGTLFTLHDTLRADVRAGRWLSDEAARATHGKLADCYQTQHDSSQSLLDEAEALFHATAAADPERFARLRAYFVEQLDAFGRSLSVLGQRQKKPQLLDLAAKTFARSLEWDRDDDYAHHYLAFNLDIQGRQAAEVDEHYRSAITLARRHPWWHSRYVSFLVTRGRTHDARRAWDDALDALRLPDPNADADVYEELHMWVARLLVHRGELDFAREVLSGIPESVRDASFGLAAIHRRLAALLEARRMGAVVPGPYLEEGWWKQGPFRLERRFDGLKLIRWMAARVEAVDPAKKKLHLRVATIETGKDLRPEIGTAEMSFAEFDKLSRDQRAGELAAGRFLELGVFSGGKRGTKQYARVHPEGAWSPHDLPPLHPDPARYLRAASDQ